MAASYPVNGKVALVTGAAKGIGFATAQLLHQRGASVALLDLDRDATRDAAERIGERTLAIDCDVTDAQGMRLAVSEVVERFGGLDIAIANAGIAPKPRPMVVMGAEEFDRVIDVNLNGVSRTVRAALPHVIERKGHIHVTASIYAFLNGTMATPYAMSKAGVEALGRGLRGEMAPHGASAGVAYFGFIDTDMVRNTFEDPLARRIEETFPKFLLKRLTPIQAATVLVDGVERRARKTITPRVWNYWAVMRGFVNPLVDRWLERDETINDTILDAERQHATTRD